MNVMVLLAGGQPLPNFLPVHHDKPEAVLIAYTTTAPSVVRAYERLADVLMRKTTVIPVEVKPYDVAATVEAIKNRLDTSDLVGAQVTFNLTGGTKLMSVAAYQLARERRARAIYLESEKRQTIIYRYGWKQDQLQVLKEDTISVPLASDDFLDLYIGIGKWRELPIDPRKEGGPFELAIVNALRPHVDEIRPGIHLHDDQVDIDVLVRCGDQFGIIEAKSGGKGRSLEGIKQLSTAGRLLGLYTQQCYVITVPPTQRHHALKDAARIETVAITDYVARSTTISEASTQMLAQTVRKQLKGV